MYAEHPMKLAGQKGSTHLLILFLCFSVCSLSLMIAQYWLSGHRLDGTSAMTPWLCGRFRRVEAAYTLLDRRMDLELERF
jgi:hypothetical protein